MLANVDLWLLLAKIFNPVTFNPITKNTVSGKEIPNNIWDFMPKVGKHIFSEVQIVPHEMQCSETEIFVVYFSVTREPNVHRIQRMTQVTSKPLHHQNQQTKA